MSVRDVSTFEWTLGRRFLRVRYHAEQGDSFAAEGYLWHSAAERRVQFQEFSTGARPVRLLAGTCGADALVLEETLRDRQVRLVFRFVDASTMEMTETDVRNELLVVFVRLLFKKQASGVGTPKGKWNRTMDVVPQDRSTWASPRARSRSPR